MNEEQLITDLGAGEYTKEYFSTGRYQILCNSSLGHSVPVISGELQKEGKQYRASEFTSDGRGFTRVEFAGAYGSPAVKKLVREARFSLENGSLQIKDEFELSEHAEGVTEQLVTQGQVEFSPEGIRIKGVNSACLIRLPEKIQNLRVVEKQHSNHVGQLEIVRLIQWEIEEKDKDCTAETRWNIVPYTD